MQGQGELQAKNEAILGKSGGKPGTEKGVVTGGLALQGASALQGARLRYRGRAKSTLCYFSYSSPNIAVFRGYFVLFIP
jgi:hypothetical protein